MPMTTQPYQATEERKHLPQEVRVRNKELTSSHQPGFCRGQQEVSKRWETAGTLDRLHGGLTPIGSRAVRRFIDSRQPPLTLHGHVHESPGVERLGKTVCVNPGDSMARLHAVRVDLATFVVTP